MNRGWDCFQSSTQLPICFKMNLTSDTFFHFTKNLDSIKSILSDGFNVYYCKEEIYSDTHGRVEHIGIPMVCFCDKPLSSIRQNNYGHYAIGMSRSWGISKRLMPVHYYPNNKKCFSTKTIIKATKAFLSPGGKYDDYRILGYSKPMNKIAKQENQCKNNYSEHEWRYIYDTSTYPWKSGEDYDLYRKEQGTKIPVGNPLTFNASEIDFILVGKKDIDDIQSYIMGVLPIIGRKNKITDSDKYRLLTKLLIYEDLVKNI